MQPSYSTQSAGRYAPRRDKQKTKYPETSEWAARSGDQEWMKRQALAYLRWRLHARSKWYDNFPGVVWTVYLLVFLCWCILTLLNPHFTISLEQQSPTQPVTGMLFAGLAPILLCMLALAGYSSLLTTRKDRLHDEMSLAAVVNLLAAQEREAEEGREISQALTALLPHISAEEAEEITPRTGGLLLSALRKRHSREPALAVAILRGMEQIGNEAALPLITRLAEQAANEEVACAAQICRDVLQARLGRKQAEEVLLRPSEDTQGVLLRPASGRHEEETCQLLRSAGDRQGF